MPLASAAEMRAFALGALLASGLFLALGPWGILNGSSGPGRGTNLQDTGRSLTGSSNVDARKLRGENASPGPSPDTAEHFAAEVPCLPVPCQADAALEVNLPLQYTVPIICALVLTSGLFSGLTLGLMGLDIIGLQIVKRGGNEELARCAARIAPLRDNGNLLLCTLLLGNVAVNSATSIISAQIASGLMGFIISTVLIVVFGEILPQACCSRYALQIGARTVPFVKVMICLFYCFTKPLSILLDYLLGQDMGTIMNRNELMEMLKLQISLGAMSAKEGEMATQVAEGAMSFRDKHADQVMTPFEDMYMLSAEVRLGFEAIRQIFKTGFSRVPVYGKDKHDYIGLLCTKDLMLVDPEDEMRLGDFIPIFNRKAEVFFTDTKLVDALNVFKTGGTHMGLVRQGTLEEGSASAFKIAGLVTLEDIVEEIIQAEIVDETDVYVDVDRGIRVCDGREAHHLNLGVFDPVWTLRRERLSPDEVAAVAAHLSRTAFAPGSELALSMQAIEYLVATSQVRTQTRATTLGVEEHCKEDYLYRCGQRTDHCTLVLQGRVSVIVGREGFRTEAGAFSLLAKDALLSTDSYCPDFSSSLCTKEVRYLSIARAQFEKARALDRDPEALQNERCALAAAFAGEASTQEVQSVGERTPALAMSSVSTMVSEADHCSLHEHVALMKDPAVDTATANRASRLPTLLSSGMEEQYAKAFDPERKMNL